ELYDLTLAANYMDIPGLLELCAAKIASLIKGAPSDKVVSILLADKGGSDSQQAKSAQGKHCNWPNTATPASFSFPCLPLPNTATRLDTATRASFSLVFG